MTPDISFIFGPLIFFPSSSGDGGGWQGKGDREAAGGREREERKLEEGGWRVARKLDV